MSDLDVEELPDSLEPAEAFSLLGNETRIRILQQLWRAPDRPVRFSDLRDQVGVADSAQFNYHLGKLTDHFVRRTDEGYEFRYAGEKVVRAILAGTFTDHVELEFPVEGRCCDCGGDLEARYADERLAIGCADCSNHYGRYPFPPGGLRDRSEEEVAAAFNQRVRHLHCLAADGVCPECSGRVETTVVDDEGELLGLPVRVDHECDRCAHRISSPVTIGLLDHAAVVSFHDDHGVDLPSVPYWTLEWCVCESALDVVARDPWRIRVDITLDDETLRVTLDDDVRVVETERRPAGHSGDARGVA